MERGVAFLNMKNGVTLIELIVVLGIVALLSTIVFTTFKTADEALALDRTSHRLAQDLRRAAQMALRGEVFTCPGAGQIVGYGIHFDNQSANIRKCYLIYAECNNDTVYTGPNCAGGAGTIDGIVERIPLEQGVEITGLSLSTPVDVLFVPPYPLVYIKSDINPGAKLNITLSLINDTSQSKRVEITQKGAIRIY